MREQTGAGLTKLELCAEIAGADRKKERKNKRAQQQQVMQDEEERVKGHQHDHTSMTT